MEEEEVKNGSVAVKEEDAPFPLTELDKIGLSQKDEDFKLHTWDDLKEIIETNNLALLTRTPSQIRAYITWCSKINREYGSVSNFIIAHRLPWGPPPFSFNSSTPLSDPSDYRILVNDWPYGFTDEITHIVVWSKTPIPTDEGTGDLTKDSRNRVEGWVKRTFGDRLGEERVLWFKNWVGLQSVRALEHFHVLVRGAGEEDISFWTGETQGRM
ncbi:hypothetical protein GLAREA_04769 [Glarea lozoyensis ATCC 20868]|uniref:N-acetylglucosamine-induced protein 1 n=1 Tax=Glarea lozoyensis (strain ATCC 20868 / MF5171) TaxID=1116229 RepID=S3DNB7_GLAL2|nr:uncharacterized protein GLAREA_04769 [Glarea lozoyensis ATCC 20868]EPE27978.1 hypothetical protein GLAREA_04769 [Glarea lozoyensis ATCC 20868]